jgi:hypothetical protein
MAKPAAPVSAIDAIPLALKRVQQQLLPIRFGFWWRMAVVALFAGELGGGGGGFNGLSGLNFPQQQPRRSPGNHLFTAGFPQIDWHRMLPWIIMLALALAVLFMVFLYLYSTFRFILVESTITGECRIRAGWSKWNQCGARYLVFVIFFMLIVWAAIALLIGLPILLAWHNGVFRASGQHLGALLGGGLALFLVFVAVALVSLIIQVGVRDFLLPYMALENSTVAEAWDRFVPTLFAQKGSFAGYFGMKALLAIAVSVVLGIINFFIILVLLIPAAIIIALFVAAGAHKAGIIVLAVLFVLAFFVVLVALMAILAVPSALFFESYALYFIGSRYDRLGGLMWPEAPPAPVAAPATPPVIPPTASEGGPLPAPA